MYFVLVEQMDSSFSVKSFVDSDEALDCVKDVFENGKKAFLSQEIPVKIKVEVEI
ncbi:hypothetical protein [Lederbergia lenta]|uniref:hypothetical protein n=1 Tax=Lederbergia lenta TaxID=1467 RepID=UPI00203FFA57|nr:hypothetical protein [Lederbergia lenta]MCM3111658.1 hypothetical protein [Lederbergia lenta]